MKDNSKAPVSKKTLVLVVLACILLLFSAFQGTRAALTYYSEDYITQVSMRNIGITLLENGTAVDVRNGYSENTGTWQTSGDKTLVKDILKETDGNLLLGHAYKMELGVQNSAEIDQFVMVSVYKRWVDKNGDPATDLDPSAIDIHFTGNGWQEVKDMATPEGTVLVYNKKLAAGEAAPIFADKVTIKDWVAGKATTTTWTEGNKTWTKTVYDYNGYKFIVECEANAVQTHNAEQAIKSAWGINVSVDGAKNLTLVSW